jgi:hypothetical protein
LLDESLHRSRDFFDRHVQIDTMLVEQIADLAMSFTGLLLPQYENMSPTSLFPAQLGELALMLWLMIKGAEPQPLGAAASSLAAG